MTGRKPLILALLLFNAALVGVLVVAHVGTLQAQVVPAAVGRFMLITQQTDSDQSLVWVLDTVTRRMICYRVDRRSGRLDAVKRVPLRDVFRYREPEEQPRRGTR